MSYIKNFAGQILYKVESEYIRDFYGKILYKFDGDIPHPALCAFVAKLMEA